MTRLALLAAAVALLAGGCGGDAERLSLPPGQSFAAKVDLTPTTSAFGDPLKATVHILLDRDRIDPDSIKVLARFRPYTERTRIERVDSGNLTALTYTYTLHCLTLACVPPQGVDNTLRSDFWEARITSDLGSVLALPFPDARMIARVEQEEFVPENAAEVERWPPRWRAALALPEPSYLASPALLSAVLAVLGLALAGGSAFAGLRLLRGGRLFRAPEVTPLEIGRAHV